MSARRSAPGHDPFGTAELRRVVLAAWAASPARFREDANAEEALAVGGYAGRLLIELAANAVDAGREAGEPGRVRFTLLADPPEFRAANRGAPLTAAGVSGLASLRASAKRGESAAVGHFGVGFTAVLAVTDAPSVLSRTGGVRFSRSGTAAAVAELDAPELAVEVAARQGQVPALRLPWPLDPVVAQQDPLPDGFDTQVRLPLRADIGAELADLLDAVGDELLWALPGLVEVEIDRPGRSRRTLRRVELPDGRTRVDEDGESTSYRVATGHGLLPTALLADRPVEERDRDRWQISWILPEPVPRPVVDLFDDPAAATAPSYLGAPTPTDEPLSLPARLVGTFPVDDTRRRLAPGPLADHLLHQAAELYVELFTTEPAASRLRLVPAAGFPLGPVDATLRERILARLARSPVLVSVRDEPVVPLDAVVVAGISVDAAGLLGRAVPGLVADPGTPAGLAALRLLGVRMLPVAAATSALAAVDGPPEFWRRVYQALADQRTEDLADLPVPLAGGGRRIGPAGVLLPGPDALDPEVLDRAARVAPELRIVHPDAAHPLLARLGAQPADAAAVLADPALAQRFSEFRQELQDADPDPDELGELARLALALATENAPPGGLLDDVVLTDATGEAWPAAELLAPDAPLAAVLAADADLPLVGVEWTGFPAAALARVGVRTGLRVIPVADRDADLPDLDEWWDEVVGDGLPPETFDAVADLDLIDDRRWPELLALLAADPKAMAALASGPEPSYTRWWLAHFATIAGEPPSHWRLPGATGLTGMYDVLPIDLDPVPAAAVGVLAQGADAVRSDPIELLRRWSDPDRAVPPGVVPALTELVVTALQDDAELALPDVVRTSSGAVRPAGEVLVLDQPWLAQVLPAERLIPGGTDPDRVARWLDLDLASAAVVTHRGPGMAGPGPADLRKAVDRVALALGFEPGVLLPLDRLVVPGLSVAVDGGAEQRVSWWMDSEGPVCDGTPAGLGRLAAHRAGRWADRGPAVSAAAGDELYAVEDGWSAASSDRR